MPYRFMPLIGPVIDLALFFEKQLLLQKIDVSDINLNCKAKHYYVYLEFIDIKVIKSVALLVVTVALTIFFNMPLGCVLIPATFFPLVELSDSQYISFNKEKLLENYKAIKNKNLVKNHPELKTIESQIVTALTTSYKLCDDKEFMLELVKLKPDFLFYGSDSVRNDFEIVKLSGYFQLAGIKLKKNKYQILQLAKLADFYFNEIPDVIKYDRPFLAAFLSLKGSFIFEIGMENDPFLRKCALQSTTLTNEEGIKLGILELKHKGKNPIMSMIDDLF